METNKPDQHSIKHVIRPQDHVGSIESDDCPDFFSTSVPLPVQTTHVSLAHLKLRGKTTLAYMLFAMCLLSLALLWVNNAPYQPIYMMIFGAAISLPAIIRDRIDTRRFRNKSQRWGFFIGENELIYRKPQHVIRVRKEQIQDVLFIPHQNRKHRANGLKITYQTKAHFPEATLEVDDTMFDSTIALKEIIDNWRSKTPEESEETSRAEAEKQQQEAWNRQYKRIYTYRRWLPSHVVDAIPSIPCKTANRMAFLATLKPYQHRMLLADVYHRTILSISGLTTHSLSILYLYELMISTNKENLLSLEMMLGVMLTLPSIFIFTWVYSLFLYRQWQDRRFAFGKTIVASIFYLFATTVTNSLLVFCVDIAIHFLS